MGLYLTDFATHKDKPIYRSYLDVVISGCREVDIRHDLQGVFYDDCGKTLSLDEKLIINDLADPRYLRHPKVLLTRKQQELELLREYYEKDWPGHLLEINQLLEKLDFRHQ